MHCEFDAVVQVSPDRQLGIVVQEVQVSAAPLTPSTRYIPFWHCWHCESEALVQVRDETQPLIPVQGTHADPSSLK